MKSGMFVEINNKSLFQESNMSLSLNLRTAKSLNRGSHSQGSRSSDSPSTSSNDLSALLTLPDTDTSSLHSVLTAEGTSITTQ